VPIEDIVRAVFKYPDRCLDGERVTCDAPRECPNRDEWGCHNCGYVVCGECHEPLSDRHLANPFGVDGQKV